MFYRSVLMCRSDAPKKMLRLVHKELKYEPIGSFLRDVFQFAVKRPSGDAEVIRGVAFIAAV